MDRTGANPSIVTMRPAGRLLVSVVEAEEVAAAVAGGADIIDVKDPRRGALGRPEDAVVEAVRAATPDGLPVSVALGDGPLGSTAAIAAAVAAAARGAAFVKLGLRDTALVAARETLMAVRAALPSPVALVVAGFADAVRAGAPPPGALPALAEAAGAQGCLLDTAVKDGRGLLDWLDEPALRAFLADCRERGLLSTLAVSLRPEDFARLAPLGPDILGVRGAACDGDRVTGRVAAERVRRLARALRSGAPAPAPRASLPGRA